MEYTKVLCNTICSLLLIAVSANTQKPCFDPRNPGQICFIENPSSPPPWVIQQPGANQLLANQWQVANEQPLSSLPPQGFQQQAVNQQPLGIQQPLGSQQLLTIQQQVTNQESLEIQRQAAIRQAASQQAASQQAASQQPPNHKIVAMTRAKKIIHLDETSVALTNFSINLMKYVALQSPGNTVVSPHSIATLLALIQQGATGGTLDELSIALKMNPQGSATAFKTYSDDLQMRRSRNILKTANNIFIANGFNLNPNFRATALKDFRSHVTPTNFALAVETAREINQWVAERTDNKILNLITPDILGINTQMVLVNAIYFKGLWEIPFRREATKPGNFLLSSGEVVKAQYMQTRRYFKTGTDADTGANIIVLPFEREEYSLIVILPHTLSSVADTLSTLTATRLEKYLNFRHLETQLELPRFSIKADTDLTTVLKQMGISKIFTNSELSNIGTFQDKSPQVSAAVHSAALTIDEEGGSASAATAFAVVALSNDEPSAIFKANRPFLAVLWDVRSNLPLFTAKIEDPTL